jgi:hypothetical protein
LVVLGPVSVFPLSVVLLGKFPLGTPVVFSLVVMFGESVWVAESSVGKIFHPPTPAGLAVICFFFYWSADKSLPELLTCPTTSSVPTGILPCCGLSMDYSFLLAAPLREPRKKFQIW